MVLKQYATRNATLRRQADTEIKRRRRDSRRAHLVEQALLEGLSWTDAIKRAALRENVDTAAIVVSHRHERKRLAEIFSLDTARPLSRKKAKA